MKRIALSLALAAALLCCSCRNNAARMVEHVPALDITEEAGTIELKDYL